MLRLLRIGLPPLIFLGLVLPSAVAWRHVPVAPPVASAVPVLGGKEWFSETKRLLREQAIVDSPEAALRTLRLLMRTDPRVGAYCHGLAHEVGHAALGTYGFAAAMAMHDDLCGSGYVHGVVEQALGDTEDADLVGAAVRECGAENPVCYHGVGHGFMAALHGDDRAAMTRCRELPEPLMRIKCAEGVFMQHFAPEGGGPEPSIDLDAALRRCAGEGSPYDLACAYYAPRAYLRLHPDDAAGAVAWCRRGGPVRFYCMRGTGAMLMKRHVSDPRAAERLCLAAGDRDEAQTCAAGMVSYWIVHHASVEKGAELCEVLDPVLRGVCRETVQDGRSAYPDE